MGDYKGSHNVWCLEARVDEGRQVPDIETLQNDFDLVPVIPNLNETILINNNVFRAKDKKALRNIKNYCRKYLNIQEKVKKFEQELSEVNNAYMFSK